MQIIPGKICHVFSGVITAFECKWNVKAKGGLSRAFSNAYPEAKTHLIHPGNAHEFLVSKN